MSRRAGLIAGGLALLAVAAAVVFWTFRHYEPDPSKYPVRGIDVSHHQGGVDWAKAAGDGVAFAYLKASEGRDHQDDLFAANWTAARAAGLRVGAYHFFTFCSSGRAQAANFLAAAPPAADALPAAVDLEFGGNCAARPDGAALARELSAFVAMVERRTGKPVVFYVTAEFMAAYGPVLPPRGLWRRSILHAPARDQAWVLWQFHNKGAVAGVKGPVDISVFNGGKGAFARFAAGR
jgi:lysozyme